MFFRAGTIGVLGLPGSGPGPRRTRTRTRIRTDPDPDRARKTIDPNKEACRQHASRTSKTSLFSTGLQRPPSLQRGRHPKPENQNPKPQTQNPNPKQKPKTQNRNPKAQKSKFKTQNPQPKTQNQKSKTQNPKGTENTTALGRFKYMYICREGSGPLGFRI